MVSLKSFCETLAPIANFATPVTLYERQRALAKIGLLPEPVRGRGKGLVATPYSVAAMLIALMASDSVAETDHRVSLLAHQRAERCRFTGKATFIDAVATILESPTLAERLIKIQVSRTDIAGRIHFSNVRSRGRKSDPRFTEFGKFSEFPDRLEVEAVFWGHVVERIQKSLLREAGA